MVRRSVASSMICVLGFMRFHSFSVILQNTGKTSAKHRRAVTRTSPGGNKKILPPAGLTHTQSHPAAPGTVRTAAVSPILPASRYRLKNCDYSIAHPDGFVKCFFHFRLQKLRKNPCKNCISCPPTVWRKIDAAGEDLGETRLGRLPRAVQTGQLLASFPSCVANRLDNRVNYSHRRLTRLTKNLLRICPARPTR